VSSVVALLEKFGF